MPKNKLIVFDGVKAIDLWNGDQGWEIVTGPGSDRNRKMTADDYRAAVPWFFRGVEDRATTTEKVSFAIVDASGQDIDNSGTWQDELELFPKPRELIHKLEMSLVMTGRAYLFLECNDYGYVKRVKYCRPTSISEVYDPETGELTHYRRNTFRGKSQDVAPSCIVAIYVPDYSVEDGPSNTSAAKAALMAAGVLYNADVFIASYFSRGAIKATILNVDTADQREAVRLQAWWEDVVSGIKNAWTSFVLRKGSATPTVIGEGLEGLQNTEMTREKRQDISTALGVPESRMWSSAANYATAEVEDKKYFEDVIIPECNRIEEAINAQLFTEAHHMQGYRWEFRPEISNTFGQDQLDQQSAYSGYVASGMAPSLAAQLVGIELPGEMEYAQLDASPAQIAVVPAEQLLPPASTELPTPPIPTDAAAMRSALYGWKAAALTAVKTGHGAGVDFDHPAIPEAVAEFLRYELDAVKDVQSVNDVFKKAREMSRAETVDPMLLLAQQLQRANDLLEAMPA